MFLKGNSTSGGSVWVLGKAFFPLIEVYPCGICILGGFHTLARQSCGQAHLVLAVALLGVWRGGLEALEVPPHQQCCDPMLQWP